MRMGDYMSDNKKTLIVSIIAVIVFIAAISAASYAFYTAKTNTEGDTVEVNNVTAKVETTLKDDGALTVTMIPGDTFEKTFSITNNGPDLSFYIAVLNLKNDFTHPEDITYILTEGDQQIGDGQFPSGTQASADLSKNSVTVKNGETKNYKLTITYQNTSEDQSGDMGKAISGQIFIRGL